MAGTRRSYAQQGAAPSQGLADAQQPQMTSESGGAGNGLAGSTSADTSTATPGAHHQQNPSLGTTTTGTAPTTPGSDVNAAAPSPSPMSGSTNLAQPFIPSPLQPPRSQFAGPPPNFATGSSSSASAQTQRQQQQQQKSPSIGAGAPAMVHFDPDADDSEEDEDEFDENGSPRKKRKTNAGSKGKDADGQGERPRRKIDIAYIEKKEKRHISFSKRKAGIMKKAYELATLTGTEVLLLVVSETGIVFTFTTAKFQPMVALGKDGKPSEGQRLIQACLASDPDNGKEFIPPPDEETSLYPLPNSALAKPFEVHSNVHGGQIALRTRPPRSRKATGSPSGRRGPSVPPSPTKSSHGPPSPVPTIVVNDSQNTPVSQRTPQFMRRHPDEFITTPGGSQVPPDSPNHVPAGRHTPSVLQSSRNYAEMMDRPPMHDRMYAPGPGHMYHERRISMGGMPPADYGYYRQPIEPMYDQGDMFYEQGHYVLRNDGGGRGQDVYQYEMAMPRSLPPSYGSGPVHPHGVPAPMHASHHSHSHSGSHHLHHSMGPAGTPVGGPAGGQRVGPAMGHGSPPQVVGGSANGASGAHNTSMYDPQLTGAGEGYVSIPPRDQA